MVEAVGLANQVLIFLVVVKSVGDTHDDQRKESTYNVLVISMSLALALASCSTHSLMVSSNE